MNLTKAYGGTLEAQEAAQILAWIGRWRLTMFTEQKARHAMGTWKKGGKRAGGCTMVLRSGRDIRKALALLQETGYIRRKADVGTEPDKQPRHPINLTWEVNSEGPDSNGFLCRYCTGVNERYCRELCAYSKGGAK